MLVRTEERSRVDALGRRWKRRQFVVSCDECHVEFEYRRSVLRDLQFCSPLCRRASATNGLLRAKTELTNVERCGTTTPLALDRNKGKGGRASWTDHSRLKREETCRDRYGSTCSLGNEDVRARGRSTQVEKYGDVYVRTQLYRDSVDWVARNTKLHKTMQQRGCSNVSRGETMLYTVLCELLGADRVDRQVIMNGWPIDVVIKNDDQVTYVQYDGVYWHGLDRSLEEIASHKKPRDVVIQQKWSIDRRQDTWFVEQGLKLIRVTDVEFKRDPAACVCWIVDA